MGLAFSTKPSPTQTTNNVSKENINEVKRGIQISPKDFEEHDLKVIILGPGESGKSTYWRQLRNLYTGGLSKSEMRALIPGIRLNIISDIKTLI